jgi:hypothetical protein
MADKRSIKSPIGRLSFPALFTPRVMKGAPAGAEPKFEAQLIVTPEFQKTDAFKELQTMIAETAKAAFGEKVKLGSLKLPLKKGSEVNYSGPADDDVIIKAWSKYKPEVVDVNKTTIMDPDEMYPGCWCRMTVSAWSFDHPSGGKGVGLSLDHVQKLKDGERIDGRVAAAEAFEKLDSTEEDLLGQIPDASSSKLDDATADDDDEADELLMAS